MKKYLLILLLFIGFNGFGQLSITPDPVILSSDASVADAVVDFFVKNDGTESVELWWRLVVDEAPEEWDYQICDCNLCYLPNLLSTPCGNSCMLDAGENFVFMIHVLTNAHVGNGNIRLEILDECDGNDPIAVVPIETIIAGTSSAENEPVNQNISLYPNPTSNGFKIKDDNQITQIALYNIVGKKIRTESHEAGQTHNISDLNRGIYLVRMIDSSNNIVKVLRITKE